MTEQTSACDYWGGREQVRHLVAQAITEGRIGLGVEAYGFFSHDMDESCELPEGITRRLSDYSNNKTNDFPKLTSSQILDLLGVCEIDLTGVLPSRERRESDNLADPEMLTRRMEAIEEIARAA